MATLNFPDAPDTGDIYTDSNSGFTYEWNGTVWISKDPSTVSNIREIDDISSGFNGSTTAFTLQVSSVNVEPANVQQLIISVGGVMQNAGDDYTVSGSTLTFTTAPSSGLTFFGTLLGTALSLNTVADGSVSPASLTTTSNYIVGGLTADQNAGFVTAYGLVAGAGGVNVSGAVTGGSFSGDGSGLTGVASTDNIITSYGATFLSNVRVAGIFTAANAYVTGILTAQTLNYNNVTDIYSTGIITATGGIHQTGNEGLHVSSGITTVGILTATTARVGLGVTINNTGIDAGIGAGIITAKQYYGDASNMTGAGSTLSLTGTSPLVQNTETSVLTNPILGMFFNQGVKAGTGDISLRQDTASGTVIQNFGVGSSVTYMHGTAIVEVTETLVNDTKYYVVVPDGGIQTISESSEIGAINEYWFQTKPGEKTLWGQGNGGSGSYGTPDVNRSSPYQVGTNTNWKTLHGSGSQTSSTFGIKNDGTLWGWGANTYGLLGQNNTTTYSSPKQVGTDKTWSFVSLGLDNHTMAVKNDGTLWILGRNAYGQLGQNNTTDYSSPKQVPGTTWNIYSNSYEGCYSIRTDGTLWSWGYNDKGQLGTNNLTRLSSPTQVGTNTNWVSPMHRQPWRWGALAFKTDGTMWGMGNNGYGILGLNTTSDDYSSPVQIGTDTTWSSTWYQSISSSYSVHAIKTDGTMWSWGKGAEGALGQNNTTNYSSPRQVGTGTDWDKVAMGTECTHAIRTDGTLWAYGRNNFGQLGFNNTTDYSSPKQIPGTTWHMSAGKSSSFNMLQQDPA